MRECWRGRLNPSTWTPHSTNIEQKLMKSRKGILKCSKALHVLHITPSYITKVQKSTQCAHHHWRNVALNCRQIDLHDICLMILYRIFNTKGLLSLKPLN